MIPCRPEVFVVFFVIVLVNLFFCGVSGSTEDGPYRGKYLGKLNTYHHQVSGEVYAVDQYTFLFTDFNYDGNGADTFFWAGAANRPGPQGFIVPDEYGKTNILERYFNKDFTLTLPENKKITEIKWISIYDLSSQNAYGDIYIPEEFEPPVPQKIGSINGKKHGVRSGPVEIRDSKTISITNFTYDGKGKKAHFYVGIGAQPSPKGFKVPNENGYLDPLRAYNEESFLLELPGDLTVFNIQWFSIFDLETNENYGSLLISDALNVPPSLIKVLPVKNTLPNCLQLHKNLQVSWEVFGPQITIELAGQVGENDYMSFGLSGSDEHSTMLGSDVAVAYIDGYRGYATDYNITALAPCVKVLGQFRGVCKDDLVGGQDSYQLHTFARVDGINVIRYRRTLISPDNGDKEYPLDRPAYIVWAMGRLDSIQEPSFHDFYPKGDISVEFKPKEPINTCFSFTRSDEHFLEPWDRSKIVGKSIRSFTATLGPSGGKRGYQGITGQTSSGLAWYVNGMLVPELWLKRGLTYVFKVRGGNNPHIAEHYHPLIITDEPRGGYDRLSEMGQRQVRVLAGVEFDRRGRPRPTAAGALCLARHTEKADRRRDDDFPNFRRFNRTLRHVCEEGNAAELEITPNTTWPDTVYYNSYTHSNVGWKIHIVDNFGRGSSNTFRLDSFLLLIILINIISNILRL